MTGLALRWPLLVALVLAFSWMGCPDPQLPKDTDAPNASDGAVTRDGTQELPTLSDNTTKTDSLERDTKTPPETTPEAAHDKNPAEGARETLPEAKPSTLSKAQRAKIDSFAATERKRQDLVGLAVGIVYKGKLAYTKGYGWEDKEKQIPVDPQRTLFRWASISKTLAGVVALQLKAQKKLDLEKPISAYYKEFVTPTTFVEKCTGGTKTYKGKTYPCEGGLFTMPLAPTEQEITSRQLLGHIGGIAHYTNGKGNPSPPPNATNDAKTNTGMKWAMKYLIGKPLVAVPGAKYSYTTFGFNLLGVVLEEAAGKSFATLVQEGIAAPAGTKHLQPDYEWKQLPHRAKGYYKLGTTPLPQSSSDVSWKLAGGGFVSTIEDLSLYCLALLGDNLLSVADKQLAWTAQRPTTGRSTYGMGFGTGSKDGRRFVSHSGSQQKAKTYLRLYPEEGFCITVMTNATYAKLNPLYTGIENAIRSTP